MIVGGSHYLQCEELCKAVLRVYADYSLETLAKLYVQHGQIVNPSLGNKVSIKTAGEKCSF